MWNVGFPGGSLSLCASPLPRGHHVFVFLKNLFCLNDREMRHLHMLVCFLMWLQQLGLDQAAVSQVCGWNWRTCAPRVGSSGTGNCHSTTLAQLVLRFFLYLLFSTFLGVIIYIFILLGFSELL